MGVRGALSLTISLALVGCASTEPPALTRQVTDLQADIDTLRAELTDTRNELATRDAAGASTSATIAQNLEGIGTRLDDLPLQLAALCPKIPAPAPPARCEPKVEVRTVTVSSDKMVVGEIERVRIEPPGGNIVARIDTGAGSSSLHAENLVEFERDGKRWVRFDLELDNGVASLERPIKRFVRVVQQADPEGSRRPVVELRLRLGNVRESVEFTLADRSHMDNEMILGRNFLTDVALVDVGRQFVQPPVNDASAAGKDTDAKGNEKQN
jgi:hypothetical protein